MSFKRLYHFSEVYSEWVKDDNNCRMEYHHVDSVDSSVVTIL